MTSVSSSRQTFREEVNLRRASFTPQELGFLKGLMVDGTEDEIARAAKRVSDCSMFAIGESHHEAAVDEVRSSFGSDRRRQSLALRRQSQVHTQIWKAHEGGLALSTQSSRRSLMVRSASSSSLRSSVRRSSGSASHNGTGLFHASLSSGGFDALVEMVGDPGEDDQEAAVVPQNRRRGSLVVRSRASSIVPKIPPFAALSADARRRLLNKNAGAARRASIAGGPPAVPTRRASKAAGSTSLWHSDPTQRSSCTSLVGIPEGQEDASVSSPWGGMQEEVEDKKMSDEDLADSAQWAKQLQMRRASIGAYDGEGFEVGMFVQPVQEDDNMVESGTTTDVEEEEEEGLLKKSNHSLIMRRASVNYYDGEGMEIADWDAEEEEEMRRETLDKYHASVHEHHPHSMAFFSEEPNAASKHRSASFDESQSLDREESFPQVQAAARAIQRSLSEDELTSMLTANRAKRNLRSQSDATLSTEASDDNVSYDSFEYDAWVDSPEDRNYLLTLPFRILGTSAEDMGSHPHVLSPPLMEAIQAFFPLSKTSDNFWMKYSMVRDGASLHTFLKHARGSQYSVLALETVDGEVFGAFTTETWHKTWSYFGGGESFLWKMRHSRKTKCHSIIDQAHFESEIDVYPYTGDNHCVQLCTSRQIAVGGGSPDQTGSFPSSPEEAGERSNIQDHEWGFGIALQGDLLHGSSSPCATFGSPSLSETHNDGSLFEIINMELWSMTPSFTVEDAQKLELGKLFLEERAFGHDESTGSLYGYDG